MLTPADYLTFYRTCKITSDLSKLKQIEEICSKILEHKDLYQSVQNLIIIPWPLIACIHFRESNLNFECHLHNGDSLAITTIHDPKGRPKIGVPPFTWIESAVDALDQRIWRPKDWTFPRCLEFLERYNGLSYQRKSMHSPYLWDYTNLYTKGLFIKDGIFDPNKEERRPGCVCLLRFLDEKGVSFDFTFLDELRQPLH